MWQLVLSKQAFSSAKSSNNVGDLVPGGVEYRSHGERRGEVEKESTGMRCPLKELLECIFMSILLFLAVSTKAEAEAVCRLINSHFIPSSFFF